MRGKRSDDDERIKSLIQSRHPDTPTTTITIDTIPFHIPDGVDSAIFREIVTRLLSNAGQLASVGEATARDLLDLQIFLDPDKTLGNSKLGKLPCYQEVMRAVEGKGIAYSTLNDWLRKLRSQLPTDHPHYKPPYNRPAKRTISILNSYSGTIIDETRDLRRRLYDKWDMQEGVGYIGHERMIEELKDLTLAVDEAIVYLQGQGRGESNS